MHDRDKLAKLFDAALQQVDVRELPQAGAQHPHATGHPHAWNQGAQPVRPQLSPEQQEYARQIAWQQHLAEQQRIAEEQHRVEMLRQAYEHQQAVARQQAWEQQQALARQQEWERQQAIVRQQEWERQQAVLRQQEWERRQALARQAEETFHAPAPQFIPRPPADSHDDGDLLSAAEVGAGFFAPNPEPEPEAPKQAAAEPAGFFFSTSGENGEMSESEEFNAIMEAKMAKSRKKNGRSFLFTLLLVGVPVLGGGGWFVSDPARINAVRTTIAEIRSVGDIKAMLETYQKSLDKIAVRGDQLDEATSMLGIDPTKVSEDDGGHFDKEMRSLSGEDGGPTVTDRNEALRKKFGKIKEGGNLMGAAKN